MRNIEELIDLNNKYRELLNEENKEFYEDILVYIRAKSLFKDEKQLEESLLEILTDIIEAQNQGIKAEDYFGRNPREVSDEILKNINKSSFKNMLSVFSSAIGVYTSFMLLPKLINPNEGLDLGKFFIGLIITSLFIGVILNILGNTIYSNKEKKFTLSIFALFCLYITLMVLMERFLPTTFEIKLVGPIGIAIILIFAVMGIIYILKEKLFYSFLPIIIVTCTLGILSRLEFINFSISKEPGKTISIVAMIVALILFYLISYLQARDKKC